MSVRDAFATALTSASSGGPVSISSALLSKLSLGFGVAPAVLPATPVEAADWNPWGSGERKSLVRVQTATAGSILKSLVGGTQGDIVVLENHGDGSGGTGNGDLLIRHNNTGAPGITVGNNIYCPNLTDVVIPYTGSAILYYDDPLVGWIMVATAAGDRHYRFAVHELGLVAPLTPAALAAGSTHNYNPNTGGQFNDGQKASSWLRLQADAAGSTLTGLVANFQGNNHGPVKLVQNSGGPLTLVHESASSTAANRFSLPGGKDLTLLAGQSVLLVYDQQGGGSLVQARWRLFGNSGGSFTTLTLNQHVAPAPLGANVHDWNPTGWKNASVWRITPGPTTLTGMVELEPGAIRVLTAYGAGLTIAHQNAGSVQRNRFYCPGGANFTLNAGESAQFRYDVDYGAWFVVGWTK